MTNKKFDKMVKEELNMSPSLAHKYMRLAKYDPLIPELKNCTSMRQALRMITEYNKNKRTKS